MSNFKTESTPNWVALFVNSWVDPNGYSPLPVYRYYISGGEYHFEQLYEDIYIYDEMVKYPILTWKSINVKPECIQSMIHLIDAMKGCQHFLQ